MNTNPDIQRLIGPLLEQDDELFAFEDYLAIRPVRHVLMALRLVRGGSKGEILAEMCPALLPQLEPGQRPFIPEPQFFWPYDRVWNPGEAEYPHNRQMKLKYHLIPEMKQFNRIVMFEATARQYLAGQSTEYAECHTILAMTQGRFSFALNGLATGPGGRICEFANAHSPGLGDRLREKGDDLSVEDKRALIDMLHARERNAIHALKLEKHWQPSLFPAEEKGLV